MSHALIIADAPLTVGKSRVPVHSPTKKHANVAPIRTPEPGVLASQLSRRCAAAESVTDLAYRDARSDADKENHARSAQRDASRVDGRNVRACAARTVSTAHTPGYFFPPWRVLHPGGNYAGLRPSPMRR